MHFFQEYVTYTLGFMNHEPSANCIMSGFISFMRTMYCQIVGHIIQLLPVELHRLFWQLSEQSI